MKDFTHRIKFHYEFHELYYFTSCSPINAISDLVNVRCLGVFAALLHTPLIHPAKTLSPQYAAELLLNNNCYLVRLDKWLSPA